MGLKLYWGHDNIISPESTNLRLRGNILLNKRFKKLYYISRIDDIISVDSHVRLWDEYKIKPLHFIRRRYK